MNYVDPHTVRLNAALAQGGGLHSLGDILDAIAKGDMQSFAEGNTWVVTQIAVYPRKRVLDIMYLVGSLHESVAIYDRIMQFAKDHGCNIVRAHGRMGWHKFAVQNGWTEPGIVYLKEIKPCRE